MSNSQKRNVLLYLIPLFLFALSVLGTSFLVLRPQSTKTKAGEADVTLSLSGVSKQEPGTTGVVILRLNTGGVKVDSVQVRLHYSKDTLRVDSVKAGTDFSSLFTPIISTASATVTIEAGKTDISGQPPRVAEVATLNVTYLAQGIGTIRFEFREDALDDTNVIDPDNHDRDLLKKVENYVVTVGTVIRQATDSGATISASPAPTPGLTPTPPPAGGPTPPPSRKKGDITGVGGKSDGVVNSIDLSALVGKIGKRVSAGDPADLNGDTAVNVLDYSQFIPLIGK